MAQGPAQGPQPATLLSLPLAGWRMAGLFAAWMVLLVKTQTVPVSKTFSSLLSPFPSHPHPFSSRVAYRELYFAKKCTLIYFVFFGQLKHAGACLTHHFCRKHIELTVVGIA